MMNRYKYLTTLLLASLPLAILATGCDRSIQASSDEDAVKPAPLAEQERDPNRLWCNEHGLYEDECTICHPEIASAKEEQRDPDRLWCNEHGLYEDECTICHPEIASAKEEQRDPNRLWCNEHGLYEDECTICHPELASASGAKERPEAEGGLICTEHNLLERECGICHPELLANKAPGEGMKVRFESAASAEKAGVATGFPTKADTAAGVEVLGEVTYNRNKLAEVTPLLGGVLRRVLVDVGDQVEAGQVLAEINSPELASEKNAYLRALADRELHQQVYARELDLHQREISARQDMEEAKAALDSSKTDVSLARQRLLDLGLAPEDVDAVANSKSTDSVMPVRAPLTGTIIAREAVMGSAVSTSAPLFRVADLSEMWMDLSIPEKQLAQVAPGAPIVATFEPLPGRGFHGTLTWLSPSIDATTRMLKARAELPNDGGVLRNAMFGRARLAEAAPVAAVSIPQEAVQQVDGLQVVFAKLEDDLYETRLVKLGRADAGQIAVLAGLSVEDRIVTSESYILKSELLKARLGAGCVHN